MTRGSLLWLFLAAGIVTAAAGLSRAANPRHGITEITLGRTPCFGTCPVDTVTLRADGTAAYTGKRFVERMGEYRGSLAREEFDRLASLLAVQGFFSLKDRYAVAATDLPSRVTGAVRSGKRKNVTDYGGAGPDNLWTIERAIQGVAAEIRWTKVEGGAKLPG